MLAWPSLFFGDFYLQPSLSTSVSEPAMEQAPRSQTV